MTKVQYKTTQMLPSAIMERGLLVPFRSTTTQFGKRISLAQSIRDLKKVGGGFKIDSHLWRRRVTATAHYLGIKVKTTKLDAEGLYVELAE